MLNPRVQEMVHQRIEKVSNQSEEIYHLHHQLCHLRHYRPQQVARQIGALIVPMTVILLDRTTPKVIPAQDAKVR